MYQMSNPKTKIKDCASTVTFVVHICTDAKQKLTEKLGTWHHESCKCT